MLADLAPGQRATITGAAPHAPAAVASRLQQLGFRPATRVDVIRRAPLGDPTIYRVQDTELCLRRREAQLIEIDLQDLEVDLEDLAIGAPDGDR